MSRFATFSGSPDPSREDFATGLPVTRICLDNFRSNWLFLASLARDLPPMGVIKSDGYGHGIEPLARVLLNAGCHTLAVGSTQEGVLLRRSLGNTGEGIIILPLLGVLSPDDATASIEHNLFPLVATVEQAAFVSAAWSGPAPLPVAVKVETGMARLGFREQDMCECIASLRAFGNLLPTLLLSHLATADMPAKDAAVANQVAQFLIAYQAMRDFWPDIALSLANSAALLAQDILLASLPPHVARPGFSLYGGNPFIGTDRESLGSALLPVMEAAAPVMGVQHLTKGQSVGYAHTFTAPKDMRIAIVGAGYSDGFSRGLSGKGYVCIRGERCPILGRVCMQMHIVAVDNVPDAASGDAAYLLGGEGAGAISMYDLAGTWGTIPHEFFTIFGKNRRVYR